MKPKFLFWNFLASGAEANASGNSRKNNFWRQVLIIFFWVFQYHSIGAHLLKSLFWKMELFLSDLSIICNAQSARSKQKNEQKIKDTKQIFLFQIFHSMERKKNCINYYFWLFSFVSRQWQKYLFINRKNCFISNLFVYYIQFFLTNIFFFPVEFHFRFIQQPKQWQKNVFGTNDFMWKNWVKSTFKILCQKI